MGQSILDILIVSTESSLEKLLQSICLSGHTHCGFRTCSTGSYDDMGSADIILLESGGPLTPTGIRSRYGRKTALVLCASPGQIDLMPECELTAVDDIWEKPYSRRIIHTRFCRCMERLRLQKESAMNRIYFDTLIDSMPDMVWFKDTEGSHLKVNNAFCQTVGKTREDVTGKDHCYIWDVPREEFEKGVFVCKETDEFVMTHREKCFSTEKVKSQHGMRQFNTYKAPLIDDEGCLLGTVGIGHDITALENMSAELELILRSMPFAILVWNEDGTIINTNEKFEEYFGISRNDIIGQHFADWSRDVLTDVAKSGSNGHTEARICCADPNERGRILEIYELPILDVFHNEAGRLCIYRDITKERELEEQIIKSSNSDFLTDLNNRRSFYRYIRENRDSRRLCLLYADLDRFKYVNDTYGHKAGDDALIATAHLLQECFPGDFIARIGGDEFLVALLGDYTQEYLEQKAAHLLDRMQETFSSSECFRSLSASIGIACSENPDTDIDELLRQSDTALYEAKTKGKARYCFYQKPGDAV